MEDERSNKVDSNRLPCMMAANGLGGVAREDGEVVRNRMWRIEKRVGPTGVRGDHEMSKGRSGSRVERVS